MSIFVRLSGFMKVALPRRLSDLQLHLSLAGREGRGAFDSAELDLVILSDRE
jgi:hypothetical protein